MTHKLPILAVTQLRLALHVSRFHALRFYVLTSRLAHAEVDASAQRAEGDRHSHTANAADEHG